MRKTGQLLEAWNREVAKALSSFGDGERLAGAISRMIRALIPGDFVRVSAWVGGGQALGIHQDPADREYPAPPYPETFYEIDPFLIAHREGRSGSLSLFETAPAGFENSAYYQQIYLAYGYSDVLAHVVRLPEKITVWIEFARGPGRKRFTRAERELHEAMFPAVEVFSARVADLMCDASELQSQPHDTDLEEAFERFGADCLSKREGEVIRLVLRGHNTRSIASELEIAQETVKRHRKHAYAKLRVSSQGELFSQFLQSLAAR